RVQEIAGGGSSLDDVGQRAQDVYGPGPSTGSGGGFPAFSMPGVHMTREELRIAQKLNDAPRDAYGQRMGGSDAGINAYTTSRFVGHVKDRIRYWAMQTRSDSWRTR